MSQKKIVEVFDHKFYKDFTGNWDNDIFWSIVLGYLDKTKTCLDVGAGRGALPQMAFKGFAKKVYGIDPSEAVNGNPYLDEANVGYGEHMPFYTDCQFDIVYANNVLEHIGNPMAFLKEMNRVITTGGFFIAKTPNRFHYMPLLAGILSEAVHNWYFKKKGRPSRDTFPTFYKLNSRKDVKKFADQTGFTIHEIRMVEARPEYLRIHFIPYIFGIAYERIDIGMEFGGNDQADYLA